MKVFDAYKKSLAFSWEAKIILGMLYLLLLVLALFVVSPFGSYIDATIGQSLELERNLDGFHYAFIKDFLKTYGNGITMAMDNAKGIILMFYILSVFATSGVTYIIVNKNRTIDVGEFFKGGTVYFWRYLRLSIYLLIAYALILFLFVKIFEGVVGSLNVFEIEDDSKMVATMYILMGLYAFVLLMGTLFSDLVKLDIAHQPKALIIKNILNVLRLLKSHLLKFMTFGILVLLSFILITLLYHLISSYLNSDLIILFFILGQLYVIIRIALRLTNFSGLDLIYKSICNEPCTPK